MIQRDLTPAALSLFGKYPVLTLMGPRQSGKTTLARNIFPDADYVNLEDPDAHALALADAREFLRRHPAPAVFDEIQYAPHLLRYIQAEVDESRRLSQYVVTGSAQLSLLSAVDESLAGRTGILELLPLSIGELARAGISKSRDEWLFSGFMPRLYDSALTPVELYRDYFRTYVERDVRQLANLRHLSRFETFVRLLAGRVGQLLNVHALAGDAGVSVPTAKEWLSVMEASYVIRILRPFHRNWGKRFVKSPKVYFTEPGLAAWLLGIRSADQIATHPLMGNLFENMVVMELVKDRLNRGEEPDLYFLRTASGLEADVVAEHAGRLDFFEIKACSTYHADMAAGLEKLASFIPEAGTRTVVYCGRTLGPVRGTDFRNFAELFPSPEDTPRQRRKPGN